MASHILSVSVTAEQAKFLEENRELSPSHILQTRINEIKDETEKQSVVIKGLNRRNARLSEIINQIQTFLEEKFPEALKGLEDEHVMVY